MDIQPEVVRKSMEIEREYGVVILAMREYGSHAKNLAGPESDNDVQFIYAEHPLTYTTGSNREAIEETIDDADVELSGWGLQKFIGLLHEDNPNAIEFLQSDLTYLENVNLDPVETVVREAANLAGVYHKYRRLAENTYRKYLSNHLVKNNDVYPILSEDDGKYHVEHPDGFKMYVNESNDQFEKTQYKPTVKRNLVVGRASVIANYILETRDLPSLDFQVFLADEAPGVIPAEKNETLEELVEQKQAGEGDSEVGNVVTRSWLPEETVDVGTIARDGVPQEFTEAFTYHVYDQLPENDFTFPDYEYPPEHTP